MSFNRAIKTEDKQEESGELGRDMDDRNCDGDGECVHRCFATLFFSLRPMPICGFLTSLFEAAMTSSLS